MLHDDEQAVFAERRGRPHVELVSFVLDENLRNARQVVDTFRPLIHAEVTARAGEGFSVEFVNVTDGDVTGAADDVVVDLVENRGWLPEQVALVTTAHRHPVQIERDGGKSTYWSGLWTDNDILDATVASFKGLERAAIVLAVDGFHDGVDPAQVLYVGMSGARDLLIIVGSADTLALAGEPKLMKRLTRAPSSTRA